VRCGSEENIEDYHHTTPDLQTSKRISRHVRSYTIYKGTGGTGHVPICSSCKKEFSNWKIYNGISLGLIIVFWLFFSFMLLLLMIAGPGSIAPGLEDIPFESIQIGFGISLAFAIISIIIFFYINYVSKSNPKKYIIISKGIILVKPIGFSNWIFLQDFQNL